MSYLEDSSDLYSGLGGDLYDPQVLHWSHLHMCEEHIPLFNCCDFTIKTPPFQNHDLALYVVSFV